MRFAAFTALATVMLFGCNGDKEPATAPSPSSPSFTRPFVDTQSALIGAMSAPSFGYQAPISGRTTFELTWGDPAVNMDLYLTSPGCRELYPLANCAIIDRSVLITGTREEVSKSAVIAGENINFFVDNRSQVNQAVAVRLPSSKPLHGNLNQRVMRCP